jgi:molecular chaperone DnaK (HSP70)
VQTALTVISSRCRFCWQQTKRKTPLTIKDIKNKRASGDLNQTLADIMLKTRKENANLIKSRVMKEYWEKKRAEPIKQLETNLRQQVAKYRNRYHATKSKDPHHALLRQHSENYKRAREVRDDLLSRARAGEVIDPNVLIAVYFTKGVDDV